MTVDKFLAWAQERPGRYDLEDGIVHAMSPEGAGHAEIKFAVQAALAAAICVSQRPCHMLPHGMTVRVDETTAYEPDALVYCGGQASAESCRGFRPGDRRRGAVAVDAAHRRVGKARRLFPSAERLPLSHRRSQQPVNYSPRPPGR